jgi:hypothetical protein
MQRTPSSIPHTDKSDATFAQASGAHPGLNKVAKMLYNWACKLKAYGLNLKTSTSAIEEVTKALNHEHSSYTHTPNKTFCERTQLNAWAANFDCHAPIPRFVPTINVPTINNNGYYIAIENPDDGVELVAYSNRMKGFQGSVMLYPGEMKEYDDQTVISYNNNLPSPIKDPTAFAMARAAHVRVALGSSQQRNDIQQRLQQDNNIKKIHLPI